MWAKVSDGVVLAYPYGPSELRKDNPNVSFPGNLSLSAMEDWGIVPVVPRDLPEHNPVTQDCVRINPVFNGTDWVETWEVKEADPEVVTVRSEEFAARLRAERNNLLSQCDWTQLQDAPVNRLAWANYRQSLRDIPNQAEFPLSVVWPAKPE
jgi:hypothetical protein